MDAQDVKSLWRELPLSADNDLAALDRQIEQNPKVWQAVAQWLRTADLAALPLGRNEIGEGAFANVAEYETKTANVYELHRRYIDVQLLAAGRELVYVAPVADARAPQGEFNVEGDFILYAEADNAQMREVSPASYQLFFPFDAHKPCMAVDGKPAPVRKICVKVPFV